MKQEHSIKIATIVYLTICIALGGCAFGRKKTALENTDIKSVEQPEAHNTAASASRGYLSSGPTIRVETENAEYTGTIIEQFEKTSKELQENKEHLSSLEKKIEKLRISKEILKAELNDSNEKLEIARQMLIEKETLNGEIERLKMDLSSLQKQIKQLNGDLLKAQISEVKTKQELVSARIQYLQGKKR